MIEFEFFSASDLHFLKALHFFMNCLLFGLVGHYILILQIFIILLAFPLVLRITVLLQIKFVELRKLHSLVCLFM